MLWRHSSTGWKIMTLIRNRNYTCIVSVHLGFIRHEIQTLFHRLEPSTNQCPPSLFSPFAFCPSKQPPTSLRMHAVCVLSDNHWSYRKRQKSTLLSARLGNLMRSGSRRWGVKKDGWRCSSIGEHLPRTHLYPEIHLQVKAKDKRENNPCLHTAGYLQGGKKAQH